MSTEPVLVTIAVSHYCEKARWALNYCGIAFREQSHAPFFHVRATLATRAGRTTPQLRLPGRTLGESTDIVLWASEQANGALHATDVAAMRAWMKTFDDEVGLHVRRFLYHHMLPMRDVAQDLLTTNVPSWEARIIRALFPAVRLGLRKAMKIDGPRAERSLTRVRAAFDRVGAELSDGRPYLMGDRFTAADLGFAALAAPIVLVPDYGGPLPHISLAPPIVADVIAELRAHPAGRYATALYARHRKGRAS